MTEEEINYKRKFNDLYMQKIIPILRNYESERKTKYEYHWGEIRTAWILLFISLVPWVILFLQLRCNTLLFFPAIITLLLCFGSIGTAFFSLIALPKKYFLYQEAKQKYKNEIKERCMPVIVEGIGNLEWMNSSTMPKSQEDIETENYKNKLKNNSLKITRQIIGAFLVMLVLLLFGVISGYGLLLVSTLLFYPILAFIYVVIYSAGLYDSAEKERQIYLNKLRNIDIDANTLIPVKDIQASNIFPDFDEIRIDDSFVGEYKGVTYRIQETELLGTVSVDKFGNKNQMGFFKGVILVIPANKTIKSRTIVYSKSDFMGVGRFPVTTILSAIIALMYIIIRSSKTLNDLWLLLKIGLLVLFVVTIVCIIVHIIKMKKISMEDINFSKKYCVSSKDEIEARYLVTPAFMERFSNLEKSFGSKRIKCSFFNDKIMFAIPAEEDLFEFSFLDMPLEKSANNINKLCKEFTSVFNIIDYFKLDEKTGL